MALSAGEAGDRLDKTLAAQLPDLSRARVQALMAAGMVSLGDHACRDPSAKAMAGTYTLLIPPPEPADPQPEAIALSVLFEDQHLIVVNKPAGMAVHPGPGTPSGTLVNALLHHCGDSLSGIGGVARPGIVHRLDKDTTGLMVIAKNDAAHQSLAAQFADHGRTGALRRGYLAFVWNAPDRPKGTVNAPLDRHPHARDKRAVREGGREAITHWEVAHRYLGNDGKPVASLLICRLETGRTHQIRVHLAHIGHPLLGDDVYGPGYRTKAVHLAEPAQQALAALGRQALHAYLLAFEHPISGELLEFRAELPADLARLSVVLAANGGARAEP